MSINHQEFLKRIKKSLYYGPSNPNRMTSQPLANHVSNIFNESHRNYSLNTLDLDAISRVRQQNPCSLILTIIYLERLNKLDPAFVKLVSPSELFLVSLVSSLTLKVGLEQICSNKYWIIFKPFMKVKLPDFIAAFYLSRWFRQNSTATTMRWRFSRAPGPRRAESKWSD